ncbi:MAG: amidohydrolase family protein [Gemmatimonadota bacterium]|nr:amidohydrolase family protein [Gemmatimonadota bacterium]
MKVTRLQIPLIGLATLIPRPTFGLQDAAPPGPAPGYAFVDATVVTMGDAGVLERHTVVVRGDTIVAVGPSGAVDVPVGYERIDASGRYLMPGLVDAHVHLSGHANLLANLRYGVTSVLQMSGQRGDIADFLALRDEIDRGETIGPRLFLTGPMFDRIGLARQTTAYAIPSAEDVPRVLRDHLAAGYDFVKVHNSTPHDVYRTLVATSSIPVVGHIPLGLSADEAIAAQAMLAHSEVLYYALFYDWSCTDGPYQCMADTRPDMSALDDIVERIADSGIAVTANLAHLATERSNDDDWDAVLADPEFRYLDTAMRARWQVDNPNARVGGERELRRRAVENQVEFDRELVARLSARGVPVLAGTDAGVEGLFPGRAIHLELRELVTAGLTPEEALATATSTPGRFFRRHVPRSRDLGRVEEGFVADLILVDADPLADVANAARLRGTMSRGVWHPVEALDARRADAIGH